MEYIELEYTEFEHNSITNEQLEAVLENASPDKVAYYLAYTNMEFGTELLDELLKYRELGRI